MTLLWKILAVVWLLSLVWLAGRLLGWFGWRVASKDVEKPPENKR